MKLDKSGKKHRGLELLRLENSFSDSGKWKTDGCWCGANPSKIEHYSMYTELSFSHLYLIRIFKCSECKREYKTKREVK